MLNVFNTVVTKAWFYYIVTHWPWLAIVTFLVHGIVERVCSLLLGAKQAEAASAGKLPQLELPHVCVQLPMYNEKAVCERAIQAAAAMRWPARRLEIQVLDDSDDPETCILLESAVKTVHPEIRCHIIRRSHRKGYKAGALENGRKQTSAQFIAILDADFVPTEDFLQRTIPHFYTHSGAIIKDLAMVQTQWGHINHADSLLTWMQSLWVDDHHTIQMPCRSYLWNFVNFTGTAGIWSAEAIERAGGWRAHSLVEDCELSFRALFAGMHTKFDATIVQPSELPNSFRAYKAQQRRWTMGWAQLTRIHLCHLLGVYQCSPLKRVQLMLHMLISVQWPIWAFWVLLSPVLIATGSWTALPSLQNRLQELKELAHAGGTAEEMDVIMAQMREANEQLAALTSTVNPPDLYNSPLLYILPVIAFQLLVAFATSATTKHTYNSTYGKPERITLLTIVCRCTRLFPYIVINTGMLPHQMCSYVAGLCSLGGKFDRTPKLGSSGPAAQIVPRRAKVESSKTHGYQYMEFAFVTYQLFWTFYFWYYSPIRQSICNSDHSSNPMCPSLLRASLPFVFAAYVGLCIAAITLAPYFEECRSTSCLPCDAKHGTDLEDQLDVDEAVPILKAGT